MNCLRLATVALAALAVSASSASAALIDDFNTPGLGEYTFSKILDQGAGTTNVSFSDASGTLSVSSAGTTGAEQVLLLRGVSLPQGQEVRVDGPATLSGANDLGLAIGQSHASLANGVAGDNRNTGDFLFVSFRSPTQLNSRGFNGNAEVGQVQAFGVTADKLFIGRTATDDIEMGYYTGAVRNVIRTVTPATLDIFSNVGFYGDLRGDGNTASGLDNLTIGAAIPEPGSVALFGLACAAGLATRRRG